MLQESDNLWWDAFATEFFEDDATLTLTFCLEDGPKRYSEYPPLRRIVSALFFFSRFFPKKPGIVSPYSVVLANAGNAFAKKLGGDGEETPLRLLVFLSGRHGSSPRSIVPASGPYARVCTHILNNYAPPCAAILQPVDLMSSSPLRFAPEYTVTTWLHVASRRHRA